MQKIYTIHLNPIAWQRAGVNTQEEQPRFYDKQVHNKNAYALYLQRDHGNSPLFSGPIEAEVIFYFPTPKSIKERSRFPHNKKIDLDNLLKFIFDSGNKIIYTDDKLICKITASKQYDEKPRTIMLLKDIE